MSKQANAPGLVADLAIADLLTGASGNMRKEGQSGGQLYRIGDLAEEFDLTLRALRFYEQGIAQSTPRGRDAAL